MEIHFQSHASLLETVFVHDVEFCSSGSLLAHVADGLGNQSHMLSL